MVYANNVIYDGCLGPHAYFPEGLETKVSQAAM